MTSYRDNQGRKVSHAGVITEHSEPCEALHVRLQPLLDALSAHIAVLDATGTIVFVNAAWKRYAAQGEWCVAQYGIGINYLQLCESVKGEEASSAAAVAHGIRQVSLGHCEHFVHEYCCPFTPSPRCFAVHITRYVDRDSVWIVTAHEDITALKHAEQARQESEERFRHLVEGSIQGILIHRQQRPLFANQAYATMLGYQTPQDILRVDSVLDFVAPHERARLAHYYTRRAYDPAVPKQYECQAMRADGTIIWVEVTISMITWDGLPAVQVAACDITQRKCAEEALRQSEAQLRLVIDHMPVRIAYVDKNERYGFVNQSLEKWHELPAEHIAGQLMQDIVGPAAYERLQPAIATVLSGQEVTTELRIASRRGEVCDMRVHYVPHVLASGDVCGFFALDEDITDHKRFQSNLLHTQKLQAVGTLAAGIAHDFNNLLGSIFGYAELTLLEVPQPSPVSQYMEALLTVGERASTLVRQLLRFSQQAEETRHPIALQKVVHEALTLLRASLPATIEIRPHLEAGVVVADPAQIHQVVMNLGVNAAHAMRGVAGLLDIRLEATTVDAVFATAHPPLLPGPCMRLTVRDNGEGISTDVMPHIFEPFFTTKVVGQGMGLGLAVVHGIVTSHGGVITVASVPAHGTTFTIYLPATQTAAVEVRQPQESIPAGQGRVLLVDDEAALVHTGALLLEQLGYHVVSHTSSRQALAAFREAPEAFDVVITDQTMPEMTGDALSVELRRLRPAIPIILCTGFSPLLTAERVQALGIAQVLHKPLRLRELARAIQQSQLASGPPTTPF